MLTQIRVHNFAIIDDLSLEFGSGLNVVTGETGSGKSLLIKSLSLLMGEKGSPELIKHGSAFARVEGAFDISDRPDIKSKLSELSLAKEDSDLLLVRRVIQPEKTKVYINDQLVTLQTLRGIVFPLVDLTSRSAPLIEITGQFDNKNLLNKSFHLEMLDGFSNHGELLPQYQKQYAQFKSVCDLIQTKKQKMHEVRQKIDYLSFQKNEIEALDLQPGEDKTLEEKIKYLKNFAKLTHFYQQAQECLTEGPGAALPTLANLVRRSQECITLNPALGPWFATLENTLDQVKELSFQIESLASSDEHSEEALDLLMDRLSQIRKLQKKFGPTVDQILEHYEKIQAELAGVEHFESDLDGLEKQKAQLQAELTKIAGLLHTTRQNFAKKLADKVNQHLLELNMKGVRFDVAAEKLSELGPWGFSDIEFKAQTAAGDPYFSLSKVASGGELSRILLALKVVIGKEEWPRTYLFDEVDTGVSGVTAEKVGQKLHAVAGSQQVICVTHLPQVAAFADQHYLLEKEAGKTTKVVAYRLNPKDQTQELARLLSGEKITPTSLKHASELLAQSKKKQGLTPGSTVMDLN